MTNEKRSTVGVDQQPTILALEKKYKKYKHLRSEASHGPDQQRALVLSERMVEIANKIYDVAPSRSHMMNLEYARYYAAVSGCIVAQHSADFERARNCAYAAAVSAKCFRKSQRFFPNFFFDDVEIASHEVYLDGVKSFRQGNFRMAAEYFKKWLELNSHLKGTGYARYDCNQFHQQLCSALDSIDQGLDTSAQWEELEKLLQSPNCNIFRTTRALWDRVESLKGVANLGENHFLGGRAMIELLLQEASENWQYLSLAYPMHGKDRAAGLEEAIRLPAFIDVFPYFHDVGENWRYLLLQVLRNSIIMKADYESLIRSHNGSVDSDKIASDVKLTFDIERLEDEDIIRYTRDLISTRDQSALRVFEACVPLWFEARNAIFSANHSEAQEKCLRFYEKLRSLPHVIAIKSCNAIPDRTRTYYKMVAKRIWRYSPQVIMLEMQQAVPKDIYAYLRPRWNRIIKPYYRTRNPQDFPLRTRVPEWMILFEKWASGHGPVKAEVFLQWCNQIEPRWRTAALRLLSRVTYLDEDDIRNLWKELYRTKIPKIVKNNRTIYVSLGRAAKSGELQLYWLKQALSDLPESERSFDLKNAFRNEDSLYIEDPNVDSVVFIDDFIATGAQAKDFTESVLEKYSWLANRSIYLCALAGFQDGIETLQSRMSGYKVRIFVAKTLNSKDRAFSQANSLWDSEIDLNETKLWCKQLGTSLLRGQFADPQEHALGWRGSEALIAFHSNPPNNLLPLFWATGEFGGRNWQPLFKRY